MKALFSTIFLLIIVLSSLSAQDAHEWIKRINDRYGSAETFSADFTQKNTWSELDVMKVSRGTMYFMDERFCMRYTEPDGQFLMVDADSMLVYDAASHQMIITIPDTENTGLRPDKILSHFAGDDASLSVKNEENGEITIRIVTNNDQDIKHISALIDTDKLLIESISYTDVEENTVQYQFENIQLNKTINPAVFEFEVPAFTAIIDQRP